MNIFYLFAAALLILLAVAHALWGERFLFRGLKAAETLNGEKFVSLYVPWHQITYVLLLSGVAMLLAAIADTSDAVPGFVLAVVVGNLLVFIRITTNRGQRALLRKSIPQIVLFAALIVLLVLGIAT